MSHNLNFNDKLQKHSFFSVKEKAWHGLGTIVNQAVNSKEAIDLAGLNFTVEKKSMYSDIPSSDGSIQQIKVPNKYCTFRTDTSKIFGVIGSSYEIVQNEDAFSFFDSIVGSGAAIYETAGCLHDGQIIFITAKLPEYIKVGKEDLIEQYLFLTSSHDGSGAIQAAFTPVRIVCNNTLNAALWRSSNKITIRHTTHAKYRLETAHKIMGITNTLKKDMEEVYNKMAKKFITDDQLRNLIKISLAPNKEALSKIEAMEELSTRFNNTVDKCFEYAQLCESQQLDSTRGTVFGAYNAVTGFLQNVKDFKTPESKLKSLINGISLMQTQKAFDLCCEMI